MKHGDEGTHYACDGQLEKYGGQTQCCGCNDHQCENEKVPPMTPQQHNQEDANGHKINPDGTLAYDERCQYRECREGKVAPPPMGGWETEFDERWEKFIIHHEGLSCFSDELARGTIKLFISMLLATEREKIVGEVRKEIETLRLKKVGEYNDTGRGNNDAVDLVLDLPALTPLSKE